MLTMADAVERARRTAARRPAVACGGESFDHATVAERCERVAGALAALGLRHGDRVAVLAANCHRYVELYLGAPSAGFVLVPLNIRLAPSELVAIVRAARPTVLITDRDPGALAAEVDARPLLRRLGRGDRRCRRGSPRHGRDRRRSRRRVLHQRDDRSTQGRDADAPQPGGQLLPQDDRLPPARRPTCSSPPARSSTSPGRRRCCRWSGSAARSWCCPASTRRSASTRSPPIE